jgi:hypothetical protein
MLACPAVRSFDFNLPRAMSPAEVAAVERLVNGWVQQAAPTETTVMSLKVGRQEVGHYTACLPGSMSMNLGRWGACWWVHAGCQGSRCHGHVWGKV